MRIRWVAGGVIPNFLLLLALQKFILFGCEGEINVRLKILFGLRPVFLPSAFVTLLRLPEGCKSSEQENLNFGIIETSVS